MTLSSYVYALGYDVAYYKDCQTNRCLLRIETVKPIVAYCELKLLSDGQINIRYVMVIWDPNQSYDLSQTTTTSERNTNWIVACCLLLRWVA